MQFIRIIIHEANDAFFNMAVDEAISEAVRQELSPPTLRLYKWNRPSLSIGHFQKISEVNIDYCDRMDYPVVRRLTGGRAVLHDIELTYSFSARTDSQPFSTNLHENYSVICNAILLGLNTCGIKADISFKRKMNSGQRNPACFKAVSYGEITIDGKKVIGSAQKRYSKGFMQHGSILLDFDAEKLCNALALGDKNAFGDISSISEHAEGISFDNLSLSIKKGFEDSLGIKLISDNPTKFEISLAKELKQVKYSTKDWNFSR
ncbi:MAG TPA: lipoate--protein ligase family protein [Nitrospirae bacterium]|nr:octanoyltransferase LipM [bacterium BMS3Abin09]GBE40578.1 octanoyltransferase LipM [bacterium BMS3Bbin09]HDZ83834.1 lipoate--protein ligase family protein [Nitrospirota bacterium]